MRWFGKDWGAPACRSAPHVETPEGMPCAYCGVRIAEGDDGFLLPFYGKPSDPPELAYHLECMLKMIRND